MIQETITRDRALKSAFCSCDLTVGAFFLVWSIDKIVNPEHAQAVFERFYLTSISGELALAAGVLRRLSFSPSWPARSRP